MEEQKLIAELGTQLNKAISTICGKWPTDQWADLGVPAMEDALEKAIAYAEFKWNTEWAPISIAPKDGTEIQVWMKTSSEKGSGLVYTTHWGKLENWYVYDWIIKGFEQGTWDKVTHWKKL
jgi:hypothetical protein